MKQLAKEIYHICFMEIQQNSGLTIPHTVPHYKAVKDFLSKNKIVESSRFLFGQTVGRLTKNGILKSKIRGKNHDTEPPTEIDIPKDLPVVEGSCDVHKLLKIIVKDLRGFWGSLKPLSILAPFKSIEQLEEVMRNTNVQTRLLGYEKSTVNYFYKTM